MFAHKLADETPVDCVNLGALDDFLMSGRGYPASRTA